MGIIIYIAMILRYIQGPGKGDAYQEGKDNKGQYSRGSRPFGMMLRPGIISIYIRKSLSHSDTIILIIIIINT